MPLYQEEMICLKSAALLTTKSIFPLIIVSSIAAVATPTCATPSAICGVALENRPRSSVAYAVDETVELDRWEH